MENKSFETQILHTSYSKQDVHNALNMPVYNVASFEFETAEEMEMAFIGRSAQHTYSRITNPTVQYFEDRVKKVTKAFSVTAFNSGMAAISNTIITLAKSGGNIVTSHHLFGNTYSLFASTLRDFDVEFRFCDLTNPKEVEDNIDEQTCALFLEIITNPQMEVADLNSLSEIAKVNNIPLVADTTIIPFCVFNAKQAGVNIEIISSTKYISGGATSLGGLIIDYANFDWKKSPKLSASGKEFGMAAFTAKLRQEVHRNLGSYMTPQVAFLQTIGLETLSLRYKQSTETCLKLAKELQKIPEVEFVNYNGLPENRFYEISKIQFGENPGAMFTFDLISKEKCFKFLNNLNLIKRATNLFDNKTLAIHPASTIYALFNSETRQKLSVSDKTIRISVGLEDAENLLDDIKQALL